ncbi:Aste57867_24252 [Aphanomyces stellatus]|uniref:Aste57867_24252 protein n=1 Tax=Aphanomyces stellatus TaxID=120398 RepID=A0A485LQ64_9STRA|nr:hypothetical protein As57867_024177 [Aphanomyces stellatus]VFU00892.1 Aste57867_24252 [Aphanomyces stellatus]
MSSVADETDESYSVRRSPTVISLGSLPPQVDGPVTGYVRLTVQLQIHTSASASSSSEWLVRVRWWGSMATFGQGDLLRQNQELCFPVHVPRDLFHRYLQDMAQLNFDVVEKRTHRVVGLADAPMSLEELEKFGGVRKDVVIAKKLDKENNGDDDIGKLTLHATLVWGDDEATREYPRQIDDGVRVWKNMDFPSHISPLKQAIQPKLEDRKQEIDSASMLAKLVEKGEMLKRAMQKAMEDKENEEVKDVPSILAAAKSFVEFEPETLFRVDEWSLLSRVQTSLQPSSDPFNTVPRGPTVPRMALEFFLCVDWIRNVDLKAIPRTPSMHIYVTHKAFFAATTFSSSWKKLTKCPSNIPLEHQVILPFALHESTWTFLETQQMVIEVWIRASTHPQLLGLVKLPLVPFTHYLRGKSKSEVEAEQDPYLGISNDNVSIKNPFEGTVVGSISCRLYLGNKQQIQFMQCKRNAIQRLQAWWKGCLARMNRTARVTQHAMPIRFDVDEVNQSNVTPIDAHATQTEVEVALFPDAEVQPNHSSPHDKIWSDENAPRHLSATSNENTPPKVKVEDETTDSHNAQSQESAMKIQRAYRRRRLLRHVSLDWSDDVSVHTPDVSTTSFGIDEETIELLNGPVRYDNVTDHARAGYRLVLEVSEPCSVPGGLEIRYLFHDSVSSLWWDGESATLNSSNEHVFRDAAFVSAMLALEVWSPRGKLVGHSMLYLAQFSNQEVWTPITWIQPEYQHISTLPLRVLYSQEPFRSSRHEVKTTSSKVLPATATICTHITSLDMNTECTGWSIFFKCTLGVGIELHPQSRGAEFHSELQQYVSYQTSSHVVMGAEPIDVHFDENVVVHPALLKSMQSHDVTIHVYHHVMDMDILIGSVGIPLATLLYRPQGIRGVFPLQQDPMHDGRIGVNVFFFHHANIVDAGNPVPTTRGSQSPVVSTTDISHVDLSIHDYKFLLDDSPVQSGSPPGTIPPQAQDLSHDEDDESTPHTLVCIEEARNLPLQNLCLPSVKATFNWADAHYSTHLSSPTTCPVWNYTQRLPLERDGCALLVSVWTCGPSSSDEMLVGCASIDLTMLKWTNEIHGWYHILNGDETSLGQLKLRIRRGETILLRESFSETTESDCDSSIGAILREMVEGLHVMDATLSNRVCREMSDDVGNNPSRETASSNGESRDDTCAPSEAPIPELELVIANRIAQDACLPAPFVDEKPAQDTTTTVVDLDVTSPCEQNKSLSHDIALEIEALQTKTGDSSDQIECPGTWDDDKLDMGALDIHGSVDEETKSEIDIHDDPLVSAIAQPESDVGSDDLDLDALNIHEQRLDTINFNPTMDPPIIVQDHTSDCCESEESTKLDLRDLDVFSRRQPSWSESDILNVSKPESIPKNPDHDPTLLLQVLEAMEELKIQVFSLTQKNDVMAQKISDIPTLVAETCRETLSASHVTSAAFDDTNFDPPLASSGAKAFDAATHDTTDVSFDDALIRDSTATQTLPIELKSTATSPRRGVEDDEATIAHDSVPSPRVHHTLVARAESASPVNSVAQPTPLHDERTHLAPPSAPRSPSTRPYEHPTYIYGLSLGITPPPNNLPHLDHSHPAIPRDWMDAMDLPRVFRVANKPDPVVTPRPLFDTETERIAKIMSGNLAHWLDDDSSDDECL